MSKIVTIHPMRLLGTWLYHALRWLDIQANAWLLWGRYETISSRAGRVKDDLTNPWQPVAGALCTVLDALDNEHCDESERQWPP